MKTNLIFKRQVTVDGVTKTITRIVPVDVPSIESGEGWMLSGHTDTIEVFDDSNSCTFSASSISKKNSINEDTIVKFESSIPGTAKLVRSKGVIKIVARKGKSTHNQTTPNSVCIGDNIKNLFFEECRSFHGNIGLYEFSLSDEPVYNRWNTFIDNQYQKQKKEYIMSITEGTN